MKQNKYWKLVTTNCEDTGTFLDTNTANSCINKYSVFRYNKEVYNIQTTQDIEKYDGKQINMVRDGIVQFSNNF